MFKIKNSIKVLHVITDSNIGGAGTILLSYLDNRDTNNFECAVLIPEASLLKDELIKRGCAFHEVSGIAEKSLSYSAVGKIHKFLKECKPDIVHTHASMSARIAARLYGKCRIVYTRHCVFDIPAYKTKFPYKTVNGIINNFFADRIIAISPAVRKDIVSMGAAPNKIADVFNGVDKVRELTAEEKSKVRKHYGLAEDDFVCAVIARLVDIKGHKYILEACGMLEAADPKIKIIIAGTGEEEQKLKTTAAEMKLKNCIFAGFVKEIYKIENIMQLQLNASYGTEASSASLLEGMSLGVPAVVSDFGGNPYVIRNNVNGIVVPKKESGKIFKAVMELRNDVKRYKTMSENCIKIFNESFTSKKMAENIELVYKEMLK